MPSTPHPGVKISLGEENTKIETDIPPTPFLLSSPIYTKMEAMSRDISAPPSFWEFYQHHPDVSQLECKIVHKMPITLNIYACLKHVYIHV
jgi:hypothetical protein